MHHQLHAPGLVEKALQRDLSLRRDDAQDAVGRSEVIRELPRARFRQIVFRPKRRPETACESSFVRPGASPNQKGIPGGCPPASSTRTTPELTPRIRHDALPSWKTSPAMLSTAKSSFTVPMTVSPGSSSTRYSELSA